MSKVIGITLVLLTGLALVLGRDFGPWARALRSDAKGELEQLVSAHRLHLAKAEAAVEDARRRSTESKKALAASEAAAVRLEGELRQARVELEVGRKKLAVMKDQMPMPVETETGAGLVNATVTDHVGDQEQRVALAADRLAVLEDVLRRHQERVTALKPLVHDAPAELARLELSVRHLREKVRLYEEVKDLQGGAEGGSIADARRALEAAHADVDARLRAVEARAPAVAEPDHMARR